MDINNSSMNMFNNLSSEEKYEVLKILEEYENNGYSESLNNLQKQDYTEIPVDIDTFIDDPEYAGWFTNNGTDIYPYWREQLRNIFSTDNSYSEIAITGSIGTGKSHITVLALAYCLYKLMCLKDPHSYYRIAKGGYIYIVFFNVTLSLSQGVAFTKFQSLLQNSPWFMKRGKVTGTKYLEYIPDMPIRFTVGSQMEHSIGKDIFCLTGDTKIYTENGIQSLENLDGKFLRVYTKYEDGSIKLSDKEVTILKTKSVDELYEIELEDNTIIRCTYNHKLKLKSGEYIEAHNLTEDMELDDGIIKSSGIYCITNLINNKKYIGKSDINVLDRIKCHKNGNKTNRHLKSAINKYGMNNFRFEILELCDKDKCADRERYWIEYYDSFNNGYNYTTGGEGISGWKMSIESRDLISESWKNRIVSDYTRNKMSLSKKGIKHTQEQNLKQSERMKGEKNPFYGKHHSEETKNLISIANSKPNKKLSEFKSKDNIGRFWINNSLINKFVNKETYDLIDKSEWKIGRILSNKSKIGMIFINKNGINKQIPLLDLELYIYNGWNKGMIKKSGWTKHHEN